jgi:bifunctional UDP-N-acetylglucosamine pyrophosphorylase/glucosamine-1-phosphate N-acetyltransferase
VFRIDAAELAGVNDFAQLAEAEDQLRKRKIAEWLRNGVRIEAPSNLFVDVTVSVEAGAVIGPNVVLRGNTTIAAGAVIEAGCVLKDSAIGQNVSVLAYSHLEGAIVGAGARVGPYGRLRPGTELSEDVHIGNFVEVKKAKIGKGSKANHLSYIGDAEIGEGVNVGCGFIACNYDGHNKNKTTIESGVFVGSGVSAVAPVTIGKDSYVATGSVINRDVPPGALAIARPRQENKEGYAERLRGRMKAKKLVSEGKE